MQLYEFFNNNDWTVVHNLIIPAKEGKFFDFNDLPLSTFSKNALSKLTPKGLFQHQKEAIVELLQGKNVCLSTGTSSGKSLIFYIAAIETFSKKPGAKIMAIYPIKALVKEQEER